MRRARVSFGLLVSLLLVGGIGHSATQGETTVEYIAHAAFVIESPAGTRVVIDPYNGNNWLGYSFPEGIEADAVAVSHPHFDHDATYYFSDTTPVFRRPGEYGIGDVTLRGIVSEHAGRARFLDRGQTPLNTVWVVQAGGVRVAHLGDSRLLNELDLEALGTIDVLLIGAAYFDAPNAEMLSLLLDAAQPKVLIPMHYRHDEITDLPRGMRPAADYLRDHDPEYLDDNVASFAAGTFSADRRVVVLKPSPAVEPWGDALFDAWIEATEGAGMLADSESERDAARAEEALWEGLFHYEAAMDLAPTVLRFGFGAGDALARLERVDDAIETLDHALARAPRADWTDRIQVNMLLGELYEVSGRPDIAIEHFSYVAAQEHTHETELRERAVARLEELR
jgi:L-ascorbate metabolism protein UlaG (beta-lactamase superfamily)